MSLTNSTNSPIPITFNSGNKERMSAYLEDLSRKRQALARIACEEPPTPPRSPLHEEDEGQHEQRINLLRNRVQEAWSKAEGNPADGRWFFMSHLLRLGVTSGHSGRWIGARADLQPAIELSGPNMGWINADTESEWREWEIRDQEERILRDKVESWKKRLEIHQTPSSAAIESSGKISATPSACLHSEPDHPLNSQTQAVAKTRKDKNLRAARSKVLNGNPIIKAGSSTNDLLKDNSLFGFSVVKRISQPTSSGKPKKDAVPKPPPNRPPDERSVNASRLAEPVSSGIIPDDPPTNNIRQIADITGSQSFISPSFSPSAIITSTPKPQHSAKPSSSRNLNSIPYATPSPQRSSPPLRPPPPGKLHHDPTASPSLTQAHVFPINDVEDSSLYSIQTSPVSPMRNLQLFLSSTSAPPTNGVNSNNLLHSTSPTAMRVDGDGRALKKARTLPVSSPDHSNPYTTNNTSNSLPNLDCTASSPVTPKRHKVPTLTELLASSKNKRTSRRAIGKRKLVTYSQDHNTAHQLKKSKPLHIFTSPQRTFSSRALVIDPYADDADFDAIVAAQAEPQVSPIDPYFDPYAYDIPVDGDASPAKSLSSLAGSDSEEDEDEDDMHGHDFAQGKSILDVSDFVFQPPVTSTQRGPFENATERQDSWASVYGPTVNNDTTKDRPPASLGPLYPAYNSQFEAEVARKVDTVSQLLDKDVDYAGWLRDPSPPLKPGTGVEDSP